MRILHLSDTHLAAAEGVGEEGVDARAVLRQALEDFTHLHDVDVVVVSGDVADDGSVEGYTDALSIVSSFARRHGAAQVYCTGNHDRRETFAAVLGSGHLDADGHDVGGLATEQTRESPEPGLRAATSTVDGYRLITLDSLVPGHSHGHLDQAQLAWLREVLATPAEHGSILVLHHPPIWLQRGAQPTAGLHDADALAAAIAGSDVALVMCGHFHAQLFGQLGTVPVWVGPGVYSRLDLTAPAALDRAVRGAAASVIDLAPGRTPMIHLLHAQDPRTGDQIYLADAVTQIDVPHE